MRGAEKHALFDLLLGTVRALSDGADVDAMLLGFEARLLALTGYAPMLNACVACQTPDLPKGTAAFSSALGGVLCRACRSRDPKSVGVPRVALGVLEKLAAGAEPRTATAQLTARLVPVLRRLLKATFTHHLGHEPKLMRYV